MQTDRPARRFFQLHLSTALVLMVLAAALLGANIIEYENWDGVRTTYIRGWPWKLESSFHPTASSGPTNTTNEFEKLTRLELIALHDLGRIRFLAPNRTWRIFGNFSIALAILTATAVLLEWRLRRQTDSKEAAHE